MFSSHILSNPSHPPPSPQMCRMLLERGCAVNYLSKTGESALHIVTKRGRFEAAMVLMTHGADANLRGQGGNTALHLAMKVCVCVCVCVCGCVCVPVLN